MTIYNKHRYLKNKFINQLKIKKPQCQKFTLYEDLKDG